MSDDVEEMVGTLHQLAFALQMQFPNDPRFIRMFNKHIEFIRALAAERDILRERWQHAADSRNEWIVKYDKLSHEHLAEFTRIRDALSRIARADFISAPPLSEAAAMRSIANDALYPMPEPKKKTPRNQHCDECDVSFPCNKGFQKCIRGCHD